MCAKQVWGLHPHACFTHGLDNYKFVRNPHHHWVLGGQGILIGVNMMMDIQGDQFLVPIGITIMKIVTIG